MPEVPLHRFRPVDWTQGRTLATAIHSSMTYSPPSVSDIVPSALIDSFYNLGHIRIAICIPGKALMTKPGMRHTPCNAWVLTQRGQLWMFQSLGQAWNIDALNEATDLLSLRLEKMSWPSLPLALGNLDLPPSVQIVGPHLPLGLNLGLIDSARLTTAFMSRWLSGQRDLVVVSPRKIQEQLSQHINECLSAAVSEFRYVCRETLPFDIDCAIFLDVNNCVAGKHPFERRQFLYLFPVLAGKVFAHDASQLWRSVRTAIDDRKSVVKAIALQLDVRPSAVRALTGVSRAEVGEYFFGHMEELIRILNQIAAEHHPASPEMWALFRSSYASAKEVFGQSNSARLVILARLRNDLKCHARSDAVRDLKVGIDEARSIDQFRQGLIGTILVARCSELVERPRSELSKADAHFRVDTFLGTLSWKRLISLARKWSKSLVAAVESRSGELEFLQSRASFFDFLGGTFLATNGYVIETLTSTAALKKQGDVMGICLRHASHRGNYADSCVRGRRTILAVRNPEHCTQSTLELALQLARDADGRDKVRFDVLQHQGVQNNPAPPEACEAASQLLRALHAPTLQERALLGIRLSTARPHGMQGINSVNLTIVVSGREAFDMTFGDKSAEVWERLED